MAININRRRMTAYRFLKHMRNPKPIRLDVSKLPGGTQFSLDLLEKYYRETGVMWVNSNP